MQADPRWSFHFGKGAEDGFPAWEILQVLDRTEARHARVSGRHADRHISDMSRASRRLSWCAPRSVAKAARQSVPAFPNRATERTFPISARTASSRRPRSIGARTSRIPQSFSRSNPNRRCSVPTQLCLRLWVSSSQYLMTFLARGVWERLLRSPTRLPLWMNLFDLQPDLVWSDTKVSEHVHRYATAHGCEPEENVFRADIGMLPLHS